MDELRVLAPQAWARLARVQVVPANRGQAGLRHGTPIGHVRYRGIGYPGQPPSRPKDQFDLVVRRPRRRSAWGIDEALWVASMDHPAWGCVILPVNASAHSYALCSAPTRTCSRRAMPTRQAKPRPRWQLWVARSHPESGLAVQRGLRFARWPRGIDLRPSCRPPTGRCVGPTHSLGSLRDAKARLVNGPLRRCRPEPGHLLLLLPPLRVRAQRTRIGTVPVQRMPMPLFLPHGRKDGTPDPELVRADGRGQAW